MRPGRNDPCPCGSGRKFKLCCGVLASAAAPAQVPAPGIEALITMINQGRFAEVQRHTEALLEQEPDSGMLWKLHGVALGRQGRDPLPALRRAAELLPLDAEAHRNLGAALRERGHLEAALSSLRRSLEIAPRDLPVLMAAADVLCALRRPQEAVPLYEQALQMEPRSVEAHNNLGNALQELGEHERAVACYWQALASVPADAEVLGNLGNALRKLGRLPEAAACFRQALELAPGSSTTHNMLGVTLAALGRLEEAAASFRQAVRLNPAFVDALVNLGNVLRDLGQYGEALGYYGRAVDLDPQRADSHSSLGAALYELGEVVKAAASYRRALELQPDQVPALLGLAATMRLQGGASEAEARCHEALAVDPNCGAALALLGELHADRGEFAQAHELLQRALAADADVPAVYCSIAAHRKMTSDDDAWLRGARILLEKKRLPVSQEIALRYALGKYHDDLRQYDQAFSHYRQANDLGKLGSRYDREQVTREVGATISRFNNEFVHALHPGASDADVPVFIVGMPRSGTSLAEQILASHPEVFGAGEVRFWDGAFEMLGVSGRQPEARTSALAHVARDYLARIGAPTGVARVVDKLPANFLYAGLIHAVFPRARILHLRRHPIDTCLSIYFQNFVGMRAYATDLENLAHYYGEYVRIMNHWRAVLPAGTLLEVPYEALVADQEYWSRRMVEFIGLPWDPRCLEFHETARVVITASRWQVRQRLNSGSVGRWRNYEKYVGPLRPLLELVGAGA